MKAEKTKSDGKGTKKKLSDAPACRRERRSGSYQESVIRKLRLEYS